MFYFFNDYFYYISNNKAGILYIIYLYIIQGFITYFYSNIKMLLLIFIVILLKIYIYTGPDHCTEEESENSKS